MKCKDAQQMMNAWIDNELPEETAIVFETHMSGCPDCLKAAADLQHLSGIIDSIGLKTPPARLMDRTMAGFKAEVKRSRQEMQGQARWAKMSILAMGSLAGVFAGWSMGTALLSSLYSAMQADLIILSCCSQEVFFQWI